MLTRNNLILFTGAETKGYSTKSHNRSRLQRSDRNDDQLHLRVLHLRVKHHLVKTSYCGYLARATLARIYLQCRSNERWGKRKLPDGSCVATTCVLVQVVLVDIRPGGFPHAMAVVPFERNRATRQPGKPILRSWDLFAWH